MNDKHSPHWPTGDWPPPEVIGRFSDGFDIQAPPSVRKRADDQQSQIVLSDGSDPIATAAAVAGMDAEDLEKYRGWSLEQIRAEIAKQDAERVASEVRKP